MPLDISWKTYLPETLDPKSFVNTELVADQKGMTKKWNIGEGCDVTLIDDDIRMLPCHREMLENLGGKVKEILKSNEVPGNPKDVQFKDMDLEFVSSLITYAYTVKVTITTEKVLGLIDGSSKCQIEFLQEECVDFLLDNILKVDLLLLVLAEERGWVKLRDRMLEHCVANFSNIIERPVFLQLTPRLLLEMLRSERLLVGNVNNVPSPHIQEKRIWAAVQQYVEHNPPDKGAGPLIEFLQHLRLPLMKREDLIKMEQFIDKYEDEGVRNLIAKAKEIQSMINAPLQDEDTIVWKRPRQVTSLRLIEGAGFANRKFSVIKYQEEEFDDSFNDPWIYVTAMKMTFRTCEKKKFILSSIRVSYSNGQQRLHGTEFSSTVYEVKLDPEERIVQVSGGAGSMVDSLKFLSNKGRIFGPFGGDGGNPLMDEPPKNIYCHLAGISGTALETEGAFSCRKLKFKWAYYAPDS